MEISNLDPNIATEQDYELIYDWVNKENELDNQNFLMTNFELLFEDIESVCDKSDLTQILKEINHIIKKFPLNIWVLETRAIDSETSQTFFEALIDKAFTEKLILDNDVMNLFEVFTSIYFSQIGNPTPLKP